MKRLIITATVLLTSSAAIAGTNNNIEQLATKIQEALSKIETNAAGTGIVSEALNAANLVDAENRTLSTVNQTVQSATQKAESISVSETRSFNGVEQSATNVANSLSAKTATTVHQTAIATQDSYSLAKFSNGNSLFPTELKYLFQNSANISNTLTATTLNNITTQFADLTQNAVNESKGTGQGGSPLSNSTGIYQDAINAVNLLTANSAPSIKQTGHVDQLSQNIHAATARVQTAQQSATNVVNSITFE